MKSGRGVRVKELSNVFAKKNFRNNIITTTSNNNDEEKEEEEESEVSVRVLGTLESFEPVTSVGVIRDETHALRFDAAAVSPSFRWRTNNLYFLIGEYERTRVEENASGGEEKEDDAEKGVLNNGVLRVRVTQNAEGVDCEAYHEAIKLREAFLA